MDSTAERRRIISGMADRGLDYNPDALSPLDAEDRKLDETSEGIDWDEIIASTQNDINDGIYAYDSGDYPTEEAAMEALKRFIHEAAEEGRRETAAAHPSYAPSV